MSAHEPEWIHSHDWDKLLKNEIVITPGGTQLRVLTSKDEPEHPQFAYHPHLQPIHWLAMPTKVFRNRRGMR